MQETENELRIFTAHPTLDSLGKIHDEIAKHLVALHTKSETLKEVVKNETVISSFEVASPARHTSTSPPAGVESTPVAPLTPQVALEEIKALLCLLGKEFLAPTVKFGSINTIQSKKKAQQKWQVTYRYSSAEVIATCDGVIPARYFFKVLDQLFADKLFDAKPLVALKYFVRVYPINQNEINIVFSLRHSALVREKMSTLQPLFSTAIKNYLAAQAQDKLVIVEDHCSSTIEEITSATQSTPVTPSSKPMVAIPDIYRILNERMKQLPTIAKDNLIYHMAQLQQLNQYNLTVATYYFAYILHATCLFRILGGPDKTDIFHKWGNLLRHAYGAPELKVQQAINPLINSLQTTLQPLLSAHLPQAINSDVLALDYSTAGITPFQALLAQRLLGKNHAAKINSAANYRVFLEVIIQENLIEPVEWHQDAQLLLRGWIEHLERSPYQATPLYAELGHKGFVMKYIECRAALRDKYLNATPPTPALSQ